MIYLQFIALVIVMAVVWYLGYRRGKTIKEREMSMMEEPALSQEENEKRQRYYEFCKILDEILTEDDDTIPDELTGITYLQNKWGTDGVFSGDISKSSPTDTNKDIQE